MVRCLELKEAKVLLLKCFHFLPCIRSWALYVYITMHCDVSTCDGVLDHCSLCSTFWTCIFGTLGKRQQCGQNWSLALILLASYVLILTDKFTILSNDCKTSSLLNKHQIAQWFPLHPTPSPMQFFGHATLLLLACLGTCWPSYKASFTL